jgi:mannose/cellobiose epimerase-like protein (N-acyl-D-glucosamine 2-epimerase family)
MTRSKLQRTLCALVAAFALALPLSAQVPDERTATWIERLVATLWEHLSTPLSPLWEASTLQDPPAAPDDDTTPDDSTDGRVHIDPNG